ncbi:MAG: hypothetical protein A2806_04675 [Candidatus Terrybacteria bacterium RIFCSPHIGHO2_01_FULL_48_17]|uniref:Type II secretion system protein GspF domain-containing protein n=1 Tax=Candidatus Terrybacteria bacterium RIFCSPHIGHO2_01_FULL_48_17 TaxID=1802362 RepID=A0A1G2PKS5_9BACT|nr:MAG: hypothetical protein A2806_04675 [Candidatus Terrybacteria bacterium RIFCSPHIGHO2_01_FULL_48_17]OHA52098.1 MAG: hypothetical protein A3A30_04310 [Candidatus Terrybacteria bacterium RIFCSPLOWO2_01_FULL_48_14]
MPLYKFRARTESGSEVSGTREAANTIELGRILHSDQRLFLVSAEQADKRGRKLSISLPFLGGVPFVERMLFTRHLSVMVEAGLDLPRAFEVLIRQTRSPKFRKTLADLREDIVRGQRIGESLGKHPDVFDELFVSMVSVGEESGRLVEVLQLLADQMEKSHTLRARIRGALIYPAIVVIAMVGIGILMFLFVVPRLKEVFADFDVSLPITTRFIFWLSEFLLTKWYLVIPVLIAGGWVFVKMLGTHQGKQVRDKVFMRVPVFRNLLREIASAQIARTLSSLIIAGVPIVRGLQIVSNTLQNVYFKASLAASAASVEKGKTIHEALEPYEWVYPPLVIEMVAVGEETGKLGELLQRLADFYEAEVDRTTQNLAGIIEPVLMVVIGAVVGVFAVSMIMPMYTMMGTIS